MCEPAEQAPVLKEYRHEDTGRNLVFRSMLQSDLASIWTLERKLFRTPWSMQAFAADISDNEFSWCTVLNDGAQTVAYMVVYFIIDEAHLANIGVRKEYQNQGIGTWLVQQFLETARRRKMASALLEVRASNYSAIHVYRKIGFKAVGTRANYYQEEQEDALLMRCDL